MGGDCIFCEEAAFMDMRVFYEVVVPLVEVEDTALILISTPVDKYNFYMQLLEMVDDENNSLFYVHNMPMQCAACAKENRLDCNHKEDIRPSWKPSERSELVARLYGNNEKLRACETLGVTMDDDQRAFPTVCIEEFENAEKFDPSIFHTERPPFIITACDPNGGGSSMTAILSLIVHSGKFVVSHVFIYSLFFPLEWRSSIGVVESSAFLYIGHKFTMHAGFCGQ